MRPPFCTAERLSPSAGERVLAGHDPAATSASFVIDRRGRVALVHPGPEFYPTHDPSRARQDRDFRALRAAIRRALDPE